MQVVGDAAHVKLPSSLNLAWIYASTRFGSNLLSPLLPKTEGAACTSMACSFSFSGCAINLHFPLSVVMVDIRHSTVDVIPFSLQTVTIHRFVAPKIRPH